jgi:uncharacterized protein
MIEEKHCRTISRELAISERQIQATAALLDEGATVPFIARYRKEVTGGLDEVQIINIRDRLEGLRELDKRRESIIKSIEEQGKMTDDLLAKIIAAETLTILEDIYLPYKPKRRTRGMIAREKGLEPLALELFAQGDIDPESAAAAYVDPEKELPTIEEVLAGSRDIMAEWINEDAEARAALREYFFEQAVLSSAVVKGKEEEGAKYRDYFEWTEPAKSIPSHRLLAIRRGTEEGFLSFRMQPDEEEGIELLKRHFVRGANKAAEQVALASEDAYKRLLSLSLETEIRGATKEKADEYAIKVFADNLRELLLASPLGQKTILALDPGLRTGCKLVCLNRQGKLIHNGTIYPLQPHNKVAESARVIQDLVKSLSIEAIAIGNGTGGREALAFVKEISFDRNVTVVMVNESGASVYSASEVARREFPDHDVTVRGAVSIGRRLMDPLAELVKIDPKSIGVGQYQHDVDQRSLKKSLDDVVVSCVNAVGVDVNTASKELLSYVSGLSERLAQGIVAFRDEHGPFRSRESFTEVSGMGPKTFEQAAGFLRIREGGHPLDGSAVHPESYHIVEAMAKDLGCTVEDLVRDASLRKKIKLEKYESDTVGMPTLQDIMNELSKPGRDPRSEFEVFNYTEGVSEIADVKQGMVLPGVVTNVTAFGAFVDIGVHQDGLVHISQLADRFVSNPSEVVKVGQKVRTTVLDVDVSRKRISLSMKTNPDLSAAGKPAAGEPRQRQPQARQENFSRTSSDDTYSLGSILAGRMRERKPETREQRPAAEAATQARRPEKAEQPPKPQAKAAVVVKAKKAETKPPIQEPAAPRAKTIQPTGERPDAGPKDEAKTDQYNPFAALLKDWREQK